MLASSIAMPMACTTRTTIRNVTFGARAAASELTTIRDTPVRYIGRRPNMSASRPNMMIRAVTVSIEPSSSQLAWSVEAWKYRTTTGSEMLSRPKDNAVRTVLRLATNSTLLAYRASPAGSWPNQRPANAGCRSGKVTMAGPCR